MKAAILHKVGQPLRLEERKTPEPPPRHVLVELKAAALNRRDYWITQGLYPGIRCPVVLGADGAGIVREIGSDVTGTWKGREVIVQPGMNWGDDSRVQGKEFHVLGTPTDGTFAEAVIVSAEQLAPKPEHLSWEEAAALPLAGLTAYRAVVVQGKVRTDEVVLVTGVGGGVALFAVQFAHASGARTLVTSSCNEKLKKAEQLGAVAGYDYTTEDWSARIKKEFGAPELIVDGAGGEGYNRLIELAAPGGTIVSYGATVGAPPQLDLFRVFWKQLHIQGSTLGSPEDFEAMLRLVNRVRLRPVVDIVFPLDSVNEAIERIRSCSQFGKIVLRIA